MKDNVHIQSFGLFKENLNSEPRELGISYVSDSYNLDLPMEYEKVRRKIKKYENRINAEWVMFKFRCKLNDFGVITTFDTRNLKPVLWDADGMMRIADERFGNINDESFHKLYKEYKSKL